MGADAMPSMPSGPAARSSDIPLTTPLGPAWLNLYEGNEVGVTFALWPQIALVVEPELTRGFLALWRQPDGTFGPSRRRRGMEGADDQVFSASAGPESPVTEAARAQIVENLSRAVTEWARQNEPLLAAAEERRRAFLRREIGELEAKLAVRREELAARERGEW